MCEDVRDHLQAGWYSPPKKKDFVFFHHCVLCFQCFYTFSCCLSHWHWFWFCSVSMFSFKPFSNQCGPEHLVLGALRHQEDLCWAPRSPLFLVQGHGNQRLKRNMLCLLYGATRFTVVKQVFSWTFIFSIQYIFQEENQRYWWNTPRACQADMLFVT